MGVFLTDIRSTFHCEPKPSQLDIRLLRLLISITHTKGAPRPRKGIIPPLHFWNTTTHSLLVRRSGSRTSKKE
jgi:hypothetical protein